MTGYAIKMTILITAMTVCIGLNTQRVKVHQTEHSHKYCNTRILREINKKSMNL